MTDSEIIELLKKRFGAAKRGNGDWVRIKCPTCSPRDAAKMKRGVNLNNLVSHCFICEKPLTLTQLFGTDQIEVDPLSRRTPIEQTEHPQAKQWPCSSLVPVNSLPLDHPAVELLHKDHLLDLDAIYENYGVGYILEEDAIDICFPKDDGYVAKINTANSLVFPVYQHETFVGWQCRFVPGTPNGARMGKMKYLHVFHKGKYLYNFDNAKKYETVIVVEGIKKAWKFPNAVATLGKGITTQQIQLLQHNWQNIIFMYDGDEPTQEKTSLLVDELKLNRNVININPAKYNFSSPDEMTQEEAQMIAFTEWCESEYFDRKGYYDDVVAYSRGV